MEIHDFRVQTGRLTTRHRLAMSNQKFLLTGIINIKNRREGRLLYCTVTTTTFIRLLLYPEPVPNGYPASITT